MVAFITGEGPAAGERGIRARPTGASVTVIEIRSRQSLGGLSLAAVAALAVCRRGHAASHRGHGQLFD